MGHTQYFVAATLDGFIADPDDGLEWLFAFNDSVPGVYEEFIAGVGAVAMGSGTYDFMLRESPDSWPYDDLAAWVFTSRELPGYEGADVRFVDGAPRDHAAAMREAAGDRHVWLVGGGRLAAQFVADGLLDELWVCVMPVVLGEGIPLFAGGVPGELELTSTRTFPRGVVELRYRLPGAPTG
jgi:dihydrofolate reductase